MAGVKERSEELTCMLHGAGYLDGDSHDSQVMTVAALMRVGGLMAAQLGVQEAHLGALLAIAAQSFHDEKAREAPNGAGSG